MLGTRMVMVLRTTDDFSLEQKLAVDRANVKMQRWEDLMSKFQKTVPWAKPGEKWALMERIFEA
jgi:L-rhamnose mutarotase